MSTPDNGSPGRSSVKTLAIRLEPDLHAQLGLIAQLRGSTITDEIRAAITAHIRALQADPDLAAQVQQVLEDIERQAAHRREAIATLFGSDQPAPPTSSRARGRKAAGEDSSAS